MPRPETTGLQTTGPADTGPADTGLQTAEPETPEATGPAAGGSEATARRLARALGWVSLGLGVAQVSAPGAVRRLSGASDSRASRILVPLVGVRELTQAAGLLSGRAPAGWTWSRVAGDAVDLAVLGRVLRTRTGARRRRAVAVTAVVAAVTVADVYAAARAARVRRTRQADGGARLAVTASITVNRPVDEVYRFWRDLGNLPQFMIHLESVRTTDGRSSHWVATAPAGRTVEWDAEIVDDRPEELIAWRSTGQADVPNSGTVRFAPAPGGRGTEVRVGLEYAPPAGRLGAMAARLFGEHPDQQVRDDLRRFKQVMETGEVVRSEASPEGVRAARQLRQRPAQPAPRPTAEQPDAEQPAATKPAATKPAAGQPVRTGTA